MKRSLLILGVWCVLTIHGYAQPPAPPVPAPSSPGTLPEFQIINAVDQAAGTVTIHTSRLTYQAVAKEVVEVMLDPNGNMVQVKKVVQEMVPVIETFAKKWSAKTDRAYDSAGNLLPAEKVFQRLKAGDAVLIMPNQKLAPALQKILNKDAVVLIFPPTP